jgi:ABC-type phosphate transport system auxiliary subunit
MQARHEGATNYMTRQHEKKILQMKDRLTKLQENVLAEKARWQAKYNNLENQLASAKDRVYVEKVKCRTLIQKQIDETERVEMMLANYAHSLQEENQELRHELAWTKCCANPCQAIIKRAFYSRIFLLYLLLPK